VFVNPHLTIAGRKINYKLRQELQERKEKWQKKLVH